MGQCLKWFYMLFSSLLLGTSRFHINNRWRKYSWTQAINFAVLAIKLSLNFLMSKALGILKGELDITHLSGYVWSWPALFWSEINAF